MIEMISRRLTKTQKAEILEAYRAGKNTHGLAEKYNCTSNTINRTVKALLSDSEYTLLKKKRSKIKKKNETLNDNETVTEKKEDLELKNPLNLFKEKVNDEELSVKVNEEFQLQEIEKITSLDVDDVNDFHEDLYSNNQSKDKDNHNIDNKFEEIAPLISSFNFDLENKKTDFEILDYESLPESVYMIVDKKVELDFQPIAELPEWSFLPENELQRNAILLFSNQRSAKRVCSRNQRVIKIPNTIVFKISKSYLISKGITRLILEDSIIGLDV